MTIYAHEYECGTILFYDEETHEIDKTSTCPECDAERVTTVSGGIDMADALRGGKEAVRAFDTVEGRG